MRQISIFILILTIVLTGCATSGIIDKPVVSDFDEDKVVVIYEIDFMTPAPPTKALDEEANKGCEVYGKIAKAISSVCQRVDPTYSFSWKRCKHLYTCIDE